MPYLPDGHRSDVAPEKLFSLSRWRELNPRPLPYQGSALPLSYIGKPPCGVGSDGFEPPKSKDSRFTVCPIWPLWKLPVSFPPLLASTFLSLLSDSNQRPRDYKSRALAN